MTTFFPASGLPIAVKARFSGRSRSSFYYKRKRVQKDLEAFRRIDAEHASNPYYGHRRLATATGMNKKKVRRIMRCFQIKAKTGRKRRSKNQYSRLKTSLPNRLKDMVLTAPNQAWSGDFTHFNFHGKTYYFATVIDAYTREIVGWHVSGTHSTDLVLEALRMALLKRAKTPKLFHSDHGSEYLSEPYIAELQKHGIMPSNSQKGKPWQNGAQESLYNHFKEEFGDPNRFPYYERFFEALAAHVRYYNTFRIHTTLKMSPQAFYELKTHGAELLPGHAPTPPENTSSEVS